MVHPEDGRRSGGLWATVLHVARTEHMKWTHNWVRSDHPYLAALQSSYAEWFTRRVTAARCLVASLVYII